MPRHPRRKAALAACAVLALLATACGGSSAAARKTVIAPSAARENFAFYYQKIGEGEDLSRLGPVSAIVASQQNGPAAVAAIHQTGALAYRYVQTYWFPTGRSYDGFDVSAHPDWAFCSEGDRPAVGVKGGPQHPWWFLDMNERAVRDAFAQRFAQLKAEGWDGVFFDRGYASMTGLAEPSSKIWNTTSTCTAHPVTRGARFADAYVGMTDEVARANLQLIVNYGVSPFDSATPMRADPAAPECDNPAAPDCPRLSDVWDHATWILDEGAAHPFGEAWATDFRANEANESNPEHGGHVMALITQSTVGGQNTRSRVFYAWSRIKLFAIPVGVGTGDDGCPGTALGKLCNRHAVYPELAGIGLGAPRSSAPRSQDCAKGSTERCVWSRPYADGVVVVNATAVPTTAKIALAAPGCRYVTDVYTSTVLGGDRCVTEVTVSLPAWSGRPLLLSVKRPAEVPKAAPSSSSTTP